MNKLSIPVIVRNELESNIKKITSNKEKYVKNPGVDFTRERKLPLDTMIYSLITMGGRSLNIELYEFFKDRNINVTASAFIQQRKKIKLAAFQDIFHWTSRTADKRKTFRGYQLLAADGTVVDLPRNPHSETFKHSEKRPNGYNQYHLNALYDVKTHIYIDAELQPESKADERGALIKMLARNSFNEKAILTVDRGYESYNMLASLIETDGLDYVCRIRDSISAMAEIRKLPIQELDRDITIGITTTQTNDDKKHHRRLIQTGSKKGKVNSPKTKIGRWDFPSPYELKFRVVRFLLDTGTYETLVTSLPRDKFSIQDLKELYHMRWEIETSFRKLKYTVGLIALHGKSDEFVAQEIYAALIAINLFERLANEAVIRNADNRIHTYQINCSMAFYLCRAFLKKSGSDGQKLLEDISKYIEPVRPGRRDKRNKRIKSYLYFQYRIAD